MKSATKDELIDRVVALTEALDEASSLLTTATELMSVDDPDDIKGEQQDMIDKVYEWRALLASWGKL